MLKFAVILKYSLFSFVVAIVSMPLVAGDYISDGKLLRSFEREAGKLLASSDLELPESLLSGLERTTCELTLPKPATDALTPQELYEKCKRSTVVIGTLFDCGREGCTTTHVNAASGFVIHEDGVVVTNYHVIANLKRDDTKIHSLAIRDFEGNVYPAREVLAANKIDDLAIFRVDTRGKKLPAVALAGSVDVGDDVHVISHPKHNFYMYSKGIVSRHSLEKTGPALPEKKRLCITADYAGGSSGGPVFDNRGNVVAIVASTQSLYYEPIEQKHLQMVIKLVIPVESLEALILDQT